MPSWEEIERIANEAIAHQRREQQDAKKAERRAAEIEHDARMLVEEMDRHVCRYHRAMVSARKRLRNWFPTRNQSKYDWDKGVIEKMEISGGRLVVFANEGWHFNSSLMGSFGCWTRRDGSRQLEVGVDADGDSEAPAIMAHKEELRTIILALLVSLCKQNGIPIPFR